MRKFKVTLTYKTSTLDQLLSRKILINKQKVLEVELDDSHCLSPEKFCDSVIENRERPDVVRINVVEKFKSATEPINWIAENYGRIYFHNGVPLILNKN